jgi:hypothetical protein
MIALDKSPAQNRLAHPTVYIIYLTTPRLAWKRGEVGFGTKAEEEEA